MRKVVFALLALGLSLSTINLAAQTSQPTIPVDQIHPGMRGFALTVFEGIKPESMDVEVLGVMHNTNGPKGDIILIRLHGKKRFGSPWTTVQDRPPSMVLLMPLEMSFSFSPGFMPRNPA